MAPRFREIADGVHLGALAPAGLLHTVLLEGPDGDVVVDAGFPWSARRLAGLLRGRHVAEHAVTHAHGDHVGASAWLCRQTGAPLAMGDADAPRFEDGRIDTHAGAARAARARIAGPGAPPRRPPSGRGRPRRRLRGPRRPGPQPRHARAVAGRRPRPRRRRRPGQRVLGPGRTAMAAAPPGPARRPAGRRRLAPPPRGAAPGARDRHARPAGGVTRAWGRAVGA